MTATGGKGAAYDATISAGLRPAASALEAAEFDNAIAQRALMKADEKVAKARRHLGDAEQARKNADKAATAAQRKLDKARDAEGADS